MTSRRDVTINNTFRVSGRRHSVQPQSVPWVFLENNIMPKRRRSRNIIEEISLPPKQMTFGTDYMFSNTSVAFTKQEINLINGHRVLGAEMGVKSEASRIDLAKIVHAESKINLRSEIKKKKEENHSSRGPQYILAETRDDELITPRAFNNDSEEFFVDSAEKFKLNNADLNNDALIEKLHANDNSQMKKLILQSLMPENSVQKARIQLCNYQISDGKQINEKITAGKRNIRKAITAVADQHESKVVHRLNVFPDPREMDYESISQMNSYYGGKY